MSFARLSVFPWEQLFPSNHLIHPFLKQLLFCSITDLFKYHYCLLSFVSTSRPKGRITSGTLCASPPTCDLKNTDCRSSCLCFLPLLMISYLTLSSPNTLSLVSLGSCPTPMDQCHSILMPSHGFQSTGLARDSGCLKVIPRYLASGCYYCSHIQGPCLPATLLCLAAVTGMNSWENVCDQRGHTPGSYISSLHLCTLQSPLAGYLELCTNSSILPCSIPHCFRANNVVILFRGQPHILPGSMLISTSSAANVDPYTRPFENTFSTCSSRMFIRTHTSSTGNPMAS